METFEAAYFGSAQRPSTSSRRPKPPDSPIPLHLNELPWELPAALKHQLGQLAEQLPLNRYPEPFAQSLATKLAEWYGCQPNQLLVGPGSSSFIRLLLTYFGLHCQGRLVITRPSFAYYEQFCQAFHVPYDTWELDEAFDYDLDQLDDLPDYSVVFLTSPNNPTGNVITATQLEQLLQRHSRSLFVLDEAYVEFTSQAMLPLIETHSNLLLLRTFSKAAGAAGLRCGTLIGNKSLVARLSGLQTPWQMSAFSIEATKLIIKHLQTTDWLPRHVQQLVTERDTLIEHCANLAAKQFVIFPSQANFVLIKAENAASYTRLLAACDQQCVLVSELDGQPRLTNCLRLTIGRPAENAIFIKAFAQAVDPD